VVEATDIRDELHARGGEVGRLPRGLVTFLFGDIEGSTPLLSQLGERYATLQTELRQLVLDTADRHHGWLVDARADGCFLVFENANAAVDAAITLQRRIAQTDWPDGVAVRFRIGLHSGTAQLTSEGYVGLEVHRAARVMTAGYGGQVLASGALLQALDGSLSSGAAFQPLGYYRLRGLAQPEALYRLHVDDLPPDERMPRAEAVE
jgi:class 3 adenylate cyclase